MSALDRIDCDLISALTAEPRISAVALAERLGLSRQTVHARLARLSEIGAFDGYDRAVSVAALGFGLEAFISLQISQKELPRIASELAKIPEVRQVTRLSGNRDLLVQVACSDARHLFDVDAAMLAVDGVHRTEVAIAVSEPVPYRVDGLIDLARRSSNRGVRSGSS